MCQPWGLCGRPPACSFSHRSHPVFRLGFRPLTLRLASHLHPGTEPGQGSPPGKSPRRAPVEIWPRRLSPLLSASRGRDCTRRGRAAARVPCWPPCTGRNTAACRSCPRKPWARSSRCSRARRGLRRGHGGVKQGTRTAWPAARLVSALASLGTARGRGTGKGDGGAALALHIFVTK